MALSGQWRRFGCCPLDQDDIPAPPPNLAIFELKGYLYRTIPEWFDEDGQKLLALQFSITADKSKYRWSFYRPQGELCKKFYRLSTSDDIVPVITELLTGTRMNVIRISKHNGYTTWSVSC